MAWEGSGGESDAHRADSRRLGLEMRQKPCDGAEKQYVSSPPSSMKRNNAPGLAVA